MFYFDEINGKRILKSSVLTGLNHFFTTRESVIKTKEPDFEELVEENKKDVCEYFGIDENNLIHPSQTHTSYVDVAKIGVNSYPDTDGLILSNKEQAVYLNFADCTPVIIYDPVNKIAAVSHAGWRGTAGNIASKTVQKLVKEFGSKPENLKSAIGPAISFCCYNVGEEVYRELKKRNLKSKIVLQVHDEMMLEVLPEEKEEIKIMMKEAMETAASLNVPLIAEISEAENWYECK